MGKCYPTQECRVSKYIAHHWDHSGHPLGHCCGWKRFFFHELILIINNMILIQDRGQSNMKKTIRPQSRVIGTINNTKFKFRWVFYYIFLILNSFWKEIEFHYKDTQDKLKANHISCISKKPRHILIVQSLWPKTNMFNHSLPVDDDKLWYYKARISFRTAGLTSSRTSESTSNRSNGPKLPGSAVVEFAD